MTHPWPRQGQRAQQVQVDLRVDHRRLRAAMTQQLTDLSQRGALAQHLGGYRVPQQVGPMVGRIQSGARERTPHDGGNGR